MTNDDGIRKAIAGFVKKPIEKLADDTLLTDLVQESFVLVEMVIDLQETFGARFGQDDLAKVSTVGDLIGLVRSHTKP
jgi:acyl carrier protein